MHARRPARVWAARLPFFYGWVVVAVAFVTMAVGVNARTAFSLLLPPIIEELGWQRGLTAGAFSFGFLLTAVASPLVGRLMDRRGPRTVIEIGIALVAAGLLLATLIRRPWHLYATLGVFVGGGSVCLSYTGQSLYLPNWFVRRRGLALGVAFTGVGVGSIALLPSLQWLIEHAGWRLACASMGLVVVALLAPLNLLLYRRPEEIGLQPDGGDAPALTDTSDRRRHVDDAASGARGWTLARSIRTARFWWIAAAYFTALYAWYAVQVHQTKYLREIGFGPGQAAWALAAVGMAGIPGQLVLGSLSDVIGREWVWTIGNTGFAVCYVTLLVLRQAPGMALLDGMIVAQGLLGYGLVAVIGAIPADVFQGPRYGTVFGCLMAIAIVGGAAGPWVTGLTYDVTGSYAVAFCIAIVCTIFSAASMWIAAPSKARAAAGSAEASPVECA